MQLVVFHDCQIQPRRREGGIGRDAIQKTAAGAIVPAQAGMYDPQVVQRVRRPGNGLQVSDEGLFGLERGRSAQQGQAEMIIGVRGATARLERLSQVTDRFAGLSVLNHGQAEIVVGGRILRVDQQRFLQDFDRSGGFAVVEPADAEEIQRLGVTVSGRQDFFEMGGGVRVSLLLEIGDAVPEMAFDARSAAAGARHRRQQDDGDGSTDSDSPIHDFRNAPVALSARVTNDGTHLIIRHRFRNQNDNRAISMIEWDIQSRSSACTACAKPFADHETYHSLLAFGAAGYERRDLCGTCFGQTTREGALSYWQGEYKAPPPPAPEAIEKESAETLLRKYIESTDPSHAAVRYILAVMLERKRILKSRDTIRDEQGNELLVYEHVRTGESFTVPDPHLRLDQLQEVQEQVSSLLQSSDPSPATAG